MTGNEKKKKRFIDGEQQGIALQEQLKYLLSSEDPEPAVFLAELQKDLDQYSKLDSTRRSEKVKFFVESFLVLAAFIMMYPTLEQTGTLSREYLAFMIVSVLATLHVTNKVGEWIGAVEALRDKEKEVDELATARELALSNTTDYSARKLAKTYDEVHMQLYWQRREQEEVDKETEVRSRRLEEIRERARGMTEVSEEDPQELRLSR